MDPQTPSPTGKSQTPPPDVNAKYIHQEFFILVLSLVVLGTMVYEVVAKPPEAIRKLIGTFDNYLCFIFLIDFFLRFRRAENKWKFMRWGWIDLISSIPFLDSLRWGRAARVVRIFRLLRAFRSMRWVVMYLFKDRGKGAVLSAVLITLMVLLGGSIAILTIEGDHPDANIKTAGDALWWAFVTITTVGYGDFYPKTPEGRFVGCVLMVTGISLLAVITGAMASAFTTPAAKPQEGGAPGLSLEDLLAEVRALRHEVGTLHEERAQRLAAAADAESQTTTHDPGHRPSTPGTGTDPG
jgi:voltage-gated potassium channel